MKLVAGALAMSALAASCGPGGHVDPKENKFLIYNYQPSTRDYRLERVTISTLRSVVEVDGDVTYLRGGGSLQVNDKKPTTEDEWRKYLTIEGSKTPQVEYTIDSDGTIAPWDFDSAMMLTVYHHLERSREYFDSLGAEGLNLGNDTIGQRVGRIPCFYYPKLTVLGIPLPLFTDNAAYAYTADAFLIPPRLALTDAVPLYANRGVMTHEFSHAVFNRLVHNNKRGVNPLAEDWETTAPRALRELGALDEGVADIFGSLDTKDPDFIAYSIDSKLINRDIRIDRYYETCLLLAAETGKYPKPEDCGGSYGEGVSNPVDSKGVRFDYKPGQDYDQYQLGSVVASIFWDLREQTRDTLDDVELGRVLARALRDIQDPTRDFRVVLFFDALHRNLPSSVQSQACSLFRERLPAVSDSLQCQP